MFMAFIKSVETILRGKTNNTLFQLIRYTFVGGGAFLIDFLTLIFLTEVFHLHYLISAGIAFMLGLAVNYILSVRWVFANRTLKNKYFEFGFFMLIGIVGLGLNELFLWVLTDLMTLYYMISKLITAFIVYFWNFFARKYLLFDK